MSVCCPTQSNDGAGHLLGARELANSDASTRRNTTSEPTARSFRGLVHVTRARSIDRQRTTCLSLPLFGLLLSQKPHFRASAGKSESTSEQFPPFLRPSLLAHTVSQSASLTCENPAHDTLALARLLRLSIANKQQPVYRSVNYRP